MPDNSRELPADPERFYTAGEGIDALEGALPDAPPGLEQLGASPFPKSGFSFLGFLATVYEHVAAHARRRLERR